MKHQAKQKTHNQTTFRTPNSFRQQTKQRNPTKPTFTNLRKTYRRKVI